ncbi:nitroreductase family deazaflavin-dependent oxidoreductase [Nakamurella antarctica]|uniref:Nitroreductase family deazaflavin-dependent oxidoreductase n=1 Tax=Nakamurella antarctica TaxID=1902245 RepID=A0A3G8ZIQ3_9ACTN|nr:nitroreductase family deazaflavin-dependent oxidoreductase [Nakamurella antarctica]AZI57090.1 nitroreductase family deazaflavin-dependent oxidoreductase [Nakamurella antarctica]
MTFDAEYEPSPTKWVRDQVAAIEESGGTEGTMMLGMPVIIVNTIGVKTGKLRKIPLMRVEHDGVYAAVASLGGAPKHPVWYFNVTADPRVEVRDGQHVARLTAREVFGDEKAVWWERAVAAYPPYAEYQQNTERVIPLFVLEP